MSQRRAKSIRRQVRKASRAVVHQTIESTKRLPLKDRLKTGVRLFLDLAVGDPDRAFFSGAEKPPPTTKQLKREREKARRDEDRRREKERDEQRRQQRRAGRRL